MSHRKLSVPAHYSRVYCISSSTQKEEKICLPYPSLCLCSASSRAAASCTLNSKQPSSICVLAGSTSTSKQRRHLKQQFVQSSHILQPKQQQGAQQHQDISWLYFLLKAKTKIETVFILMLPYSASPVAGNLSTAGSLTASECQLALIPPQSKDDN